MVIIQFKGTDGQGYGVLTAAPKDFKTGSRGFFGSGKLQIDGKRYQVQVQLVEIGSKPKLDGASNGAPASADRG